MPIVAAIVDGMMPAAWAVQPWSTLFDSGIVERQLEKRRVSIINRRQARVAGAAVRRNAGPAIVNNVTGKRRRTGSRSTFTMQLCASDAVVVAVGPWCTWIVTHHYLV